MTLNEAIERYTNNAEYERTHGSLQGCLEFRQLVEWLSALQKYDDVLDKIRAEIEQIADEEQKHDEKWAIGLRYAVKIIDKYMERSE